MCTKEKVVWRERWEVREEEGERGGEREVEVREGEREILGRAHCTTCLTQRCKPTSVAEQEKVDPQFRGPTDSP